MPPADDTKSPALVPLRVWAIAALIALIEPGLHLWLKYFPPAGAAHTGLRVPDTNVFLHSMSMFETDFRSAYILCGNGAASGLEYYAAPGRWLLGVLGWCTGTLGLDPFMALGVLNGLGMFFYLIAVFMLLREAVPALANVAFTLFAMGGGLGGVLFIATGALGLHDHTAFEEVFRRYAHYELFTGTHLLPHLHGPFLYYTLPLALLMVGIRLVLQSRMLTAAIFFACAVFLNVRLSAPGLGIALLYVGLGGNNLRAALPIILACALGGLGSFAVYRSGATGAANVIGMADIGMWLTPFLSAAIFHVFTLPSAMRSILPTFTRGGRIVAWVCVGYLAAFALLFVAYQTYYGNLIVARDAVAAVAVSDWALVGGVVGLVVALRKKHTPVDAGDRNLQWFALWLLLAIVFAVGAFAGGAYLRLTPQRLMVFIALPLAVLSAHGLAQWQRDRMRRGWLALMIACGTVSIITSVLWVQGPLGGHAGQGPYAFARAGLMTEADAKLMGEIPKGTIATPLERAPYFGDILSHRSPDYSVIGAGTVGFSNLDWAQVHFDMAAFYSADSPVSIRRPIAERYCIDFVYCPDTTPVDRRTIAILDETSWLIPLASEGRGRLYKVQFPWLGGIIID